MVKKTTPPPAKEPEHPIVKPVITVLDGPVHPLVEMFEKEKCPIIKSVATLRVPHKNTFMSLIIHTQADKVIRIDVGEPNLRAIAIDEAKQEFVTNFIDGGLDD